MSALVAVITTALAGLLGYVVSLLSRKTDLENQVRELKTDKVESVYEEQSKESSKAASDSVSAYKQLLEQYKPKSDK